MKKFGIRTSGLEEQIEKILIEHIKNKEDYLFLEIGAATMVSHRAIRDIISENIKTNNWLVISLDILGSDDVNFNKINQIFTDKELIINKEQGDDDTLSKLHTEKYHSLLVLRELATVRDWIKNIDDVSLNLCLIDGNHMKEQVILDFLAVENKIKSGGLLMFHDSGVSETGTDYQGKDSSGNDCYIDVRGALEELGLLNDSRAGWKIETQILGTRALNHDENGGNSMLIARKL